jgi:uncharacterized protein (UPF0332 family)
MSQVGNKVKWCLNKAKRELETSGKHRGLVLKKPDMEEAKRHIAKAEHNFLAIDKMVRDNMSDWAMSAVFYTVYHSFLAIAAKQGYDSENQECTVALIEYLAESGKISISKDIVESMKPDTGLIITMREKLQYGTDTEIENTRLESLKQLCRKAIEEAKAIIYSG